MTFPTANRYDCPRQLPALSYILLGLFAIGFFLWFWLTPFYADDLWYGMRQSKFMRGLVSDFPLNEIVDTWKEHLTEDNARLCNILAPLLLLLPKWLTAIFSTAFWFYTTKKCIILTGRDSRPAAPATALTLFCLIWFLPWQEPMGALLYQLGYIWSSAILLFCIGLFNSPKKFPLLKSVLAGLLLGIWHEGFAVAFIAVAITQTLVKPTVYLERSRIAMVISVAAGLAFLLVAAPALQRASILSGGISVATAARIILFHPATLILTIVVILTFLSKSIRKKLDISGTPLLAGLISSAYVVLIMHFLTTPSPRTGWSGELLAITALVICAKRLFAHKSTMLKYWISAFLIIITFARLATVDAEVIKLRNTHIQVLKDLEKSPDNTVFADYDTEFTVSPLCAMAPDHTFYIAQEYRFFLAHFYDFEDKGDISVIPAVLMNYTAGEGKRIEGMTSLREWKGHLVAEAQEMKNDAPSSGEFTASIKLGPLSVPGVRIYYFRFVSRADGQSYIWLYPWRIAPFTHIRSLSPCFEWDEKQHEN